MRIAAIAIGVLVGLAVPELASANEKAQAVQLLKDGNVFFKQARYEEALARYEQAYEAFASPKLFFNLARTHQRLGHLETAIRYYRRFLKEAGLSRKHPLYRQAVVSRRKLRARLKKKNLTPEPEVVAKAPPSRVIKPRVIVEPEPPTDAPSSETLPSTPPANRPALEPNTTDTKVEAPPPSITEPALPSLRPLKPVDPTPKRDVFVPAATHVESNDDGILSKWWFWTAVGAVVVGATVTSYAVTQGGAPLSPSELGTTTVRDWESL